MAVVGHVEWVRFARVARVPAAGEVAHARDCFEEPAGGGAVAAVALARLGAHVRLLTALGCDDEGDRAVQRLRALGVEVHAARVRAPTRQALTLLDDAGERTITTLGERLEPRGCDELLRWEAIDGSQALYFTAGDEAALRRARASARVLVASPRAHRAIGRGVPLDALVLSARDELERAAAAGACQEAGVVVLTEGENGGSYRMRTGDRGRWRAVPPPAPPRDSYGCGDSFAAGFTFGLGSGLDIPGALALGARCGAACLTALGPYR